MKKHVKKLLLVSILATLIIASALPAMGASDKVRVFVEFAPGAKGKVERALTSAGAEFHYTFDDLNSFVATIPGQAIKGLSNNPNVVDIEEDVPRYPVKSSLTPGSFAPAADTLDPNGQTIPWGIDAVQARDIWDADRDGNFDAGAPTGAGKTVCIIDTGFYSGHEDFLGVDLIGGTAQLDTPFSNDGNGHGTHVAGTIAAQNNAVGVVGVSPDVSLYIIKYFGDDGLATFASDLISASKTCAANGADVISMSLSGTRASNRERRNFDSLYADGVLSIGAASNDGGSAYHYPASYDSVVSVAALDESLAIADFSQFNDAVEIAAPGVAVLSTTPFIDTSTVTVDGVTYSGYHVEFSGRGTASGPLVDGGLCLTAGDWTGAVVLCERGDISFADKIFSVEDGGGVAALIYNNVAGEELYATMGDFSSSTVSIGFSQEIGQYLVANKLGAQADVSSEYTAPASSYEAWNGTSMATPHVSAVAALIWSANPDATNAEIREAITSTALDLGTAGRDVYFGYGLIQAKEALDFLGGGEPVNTAPTVSITSPADGATFDSGTSITFTGISSDVEDGSLNISWSSDQDGQLGTGDSVSAALTDGTHVITASVTDSGGLSASDEITVTVSGGGTGRQLYVTVVTDKPSYVDRERVLVTTTVTDGSAPVANANVAVTLTTGNGNVKEYSGITDANGEYSFTYRVFVRKDGSNTFTVVATATLTGYIEDSGSTSFTVQ